MKTLILTGHLNAGGIASYTMTLSRGLIKRGVEVRILSSGGSLVPEAEAIGASHMTLPVKVKFEFHPLLFCSALKLCRYVKLEGIDILHAQTRATAMLAALVSRMTKRPYVTTCHGYFRPSLGRRLFPLWGRRVIAISSPVRDHLVHDFKVEPKRVDYVPNGVDTAIFHPASQTEKARQRAAWGFGPGPIIGFIARLSDVKGHEFLIKAMRRVREVFPDVRCLIFGEGPLEGQLKRMVAHESLSETILFYPVVNRTSELLGLFDVSVTPSLSEGLGLSVMEAQASGLAVVASAVGGVKDIVKDGETGLLVPSKDPLALAQALIKVLSNPAAASAMGERARRFIEKNFSVEEMVNLTLDTYRKVL